MWIAAFGEAAVIVEREVNTATVHQGYIEPHNATALYNAAGQLTIWCSTQGSFGVRSQVADILMIPVADVRVIPTEIGGGFGGKISVYLEPIAALLSQKSGHRPVQLLMNRAEVLAATGPTSGSYIRIKMGADAQGRITAAEAYLAYEAGAYPGSFIGAGRVMHPRALQHRKCPHRRLRCGGQQAACRRLSRAGRVQRGLCFRSPDRRIGGEASASIRWNSG